MLNSKASSIDLLVAWLEAFNAKDVLQISILKIKGCRRWNDVNVQRRLIYFLCWIRKRDHFFKLWNLCWMKIRPIRLMSTFVMVKEEVIYLQLTDLLAMEMDFKSKRKFFFQKMKKKICQKMMPRFWSRRFRRDKTANRRLHVYTYLYYLIWY